MKKNIFTLIVTLFCFGSLYSSVPFTAGNLVLYRVGDGSASLKDKNATKLFLDEYSLNSDGLGVTLVQSIPLMIDETTQMMANGLGSGEGWLTRSTCGRYLVVPGYNTTEGTSVQAGNVKRVAAMVDYNGNVDASIQSPNIAPGQPFCSATSYDGSGVWMVGSGGATDGGFYYAEKGSTDIVNLGPIASPLSGGSSQQSMRFIQIFNGKMYLIRNTFVWEIDGLPTTALAWDQTASAAANIETFYSSGQKNYGMYFADLDPNNPGTKLVAYVTMTADGITKFSYVNGTWVKNNTKNIIANGRSMEGKVENGIVTLYVVASGSSSSGSDAFLHKFVDDSGHNANFPETGSVTQLLAMGGNKTIRSAAWAPVINSILTVHGNTALTESIKAYRQGNDLIVENNALQPIEVYTLMGHKVKDINNKSSHATINGLVNNQLYLVKVGNKTVKVLF